MKGVANGGFKLKYVVYGVLYLAVVTTASFFTLEKAMRRSKEISQQQIDNTRRYLGEEKAQEMEDYIKGRTAEAEERAAE